MPYVQCAIVANKFKFVNQYSSSSIGNNKINRNCTMSECLRVLLLSLLTTSCFWSFCVHTLPNSLVKWVLQHHFYHKQSAYGDKSRWWETTFFNSLKLDLIKSTWMNQCTTIAMYRQFQSYVTLKRKLFVKYLVCVE